VVEDVHAGNFDPQQGIKASPAGRFMGSKVSDDPRVSLRSIVSANIAQLRKQRGLTYYDIENATAQPGHPTRKASRATVQAIVGRPGQQPAKAATLDSLEAIASALKCDPWHLLVPSMRPDPLPAIEPQASTRAMEVAELFDRLPLADQDRLHAQALNLMAAFVRSQPARAPIAQPADAPKPARPAHQQTSAD
jgi:hypothetical protein